MAKMTSEFGVNLKRPTSKYRIYDALPEGRKAIRIANFRDNNFSVNFSLSSIHPMKLTTVETSHTKRYFGCDGLFLNIPVRSLHSFSFFPIGTSPSLSRKAEIDDLLQLIVLYPRPYK